MYGRRHVTGIATEPGLTLNAIEAWICGLDLLQPYRADLGKRLVTRLVKRPRVYVSDTSTLCYLVGLRDPLPLHAMQGPMAGAIVESRGGG